MIKVLTKLSEFFFRYLQKYYFYFLFFVLFVVIFPTPGFTDSKENFQQVIPNRKFSFPADHLPHSGFKTEWWYYTGFFESNKGKKFGIQYTIFKIELKPPKDKKTIPPILMVLHMGIADLQKKEFHSFTDASRIFPGLTNFKNENTRLNFTFKGKDLSSGYSIDNSIHKVHVRDDKNTILDFVVREKNDIILQGKDGYSLKSEDGTASYYYSIPELLGDANIQIKGETHQGNIKLWLDREFSSQFLQKEKEGWDWVHFSLNNGDKIVAFQVRDKNKKAYTYAVAIQGKSQKKIERVIFTPKRNIKTRSGRNYPVEWVLQLDDKTYAIQALVDDSEMTGVLPYWEGPISIKEISEGNTSNAGNTSNRENTSNSKNNSPYHGSGYLEMTGYGSDLPDWL